MGKREYSGADGEIEAVESIYADMLAETGDYATLNGDLYKWRGNHFSPMPESEACSDAFEWLRAFPQKRKPSVAQSAVDGAKLACPRISGRVIDGLPETTDEYRCIIPTEGMWLEVVFRKDDKGKTHDAEILLKKPEKDLTRAVTSSVPLRIEGEEGERYVPSALDRASLFGRFVADSFPCPLSGERTEEDEREAESAMSVQEYAGYSLLVGRSDQKAHLWVGDGGNGKGVMSALLQRFHKSLAVDLGNLDGFALSGIQDATLAVVDETPKDGFNEGRLKSLIGEGLTSVDRKYKDAISVVSKAKWIVNSNQEFGIRCRNSSNGFWRRFIFVEWRHIVPEENRREGLDRVIFEREGRAVLDWMLAGALRYLARGGRLYESEASSRAKRKAVVNSDIVSAWVADHGGPEAMLTPIDSKTSLKDDVYTAFCLYCENNGRKACASQEFWTRLGKVFGPALSANRQSMVDGQKKRWTNIDLSAREGTGHLMDVDSAPRSKAMPDFSGRGTIPGVTLLDEIYGVHVEKDAKPAPKLASEAPTDALRNAPARNAAPSASAQAPAKSPEKAPAVARRTETAAARRHTPPSPDKPAERPPVPTPDKVLPMSPRSRAYHAAIPARPDPLLMDVLDEMIYGKPAEPAVDRSAELEDLFAFSDEERSLVESIRKTSKEAA